METKNDAENEVTNFRDTKEKPGMTDSQLLRTLDSLDEEDVKIPKKETAKTDENGIQKRAKNLGKFITSSFNVIMISAIMSMLLSLSIVILVFAKLPNFLYWCFVVYSVVSPVVMTVMNFRLIFIWWAKNKIQTRSQFSLDL